MIYTTKKDYKETTIRKVWDDDKSIAYGVVGTVKDLIEVGILMWCDYPADTYCYIDKNGKAAFGKNREDAVREGL